jgi:hypothetical protein
MQNITANWESIRDKITLPNFLTYSIIFLYLGCVGMEPFSLSFNFIY